MTTTGQLARAMGHLFDNHVREWAGAGCRTGASHREAKWPSGQPVGALGVMAALVGRWLENCGAYHDRTKEALWLLSPTLRQETELAEQDWAQQEWPGYNDCETLLVLDLQWLQLPDGRLLSIQQDRLFDPTVELLEERPCVTTLIVPRVAWLRTQEVLERDQ